MIANSVDSSIYVSFSRCGRSLIFPYCDATTEATTYSSLVSFNSAAGFSSHAVLFS